jgi:hypothetical protein
LSDKKSPQPASDLPFLTKAVAEGGSDTISFTITTFIHLIAQNILFAVKAQNEIGNVFTEDRTSTWSDFSKLPSVNALIMEALRHTLFHVPLLKVYYIIFNSSSPSNIFINVLLDGKLLPKAAASLTMSSGCITTSRSLRTRTTLILFTLQIHPN